MLQPFQRLLYINRQSQGLTNIIIAASGPHLLSCDASHFFVQWSSSSQLNTTSDGNKEQQRVVAGDGSAPPVNESHDETEQPRKRQKLSPPESEKRSDSSSAEIVLESGKSKRRRSKRQDASGPNISHLVANSKGDHVVAVTAEDKCVRVFRLLGTGITQQLSER